MNDAETDAPPRGGLIGRSVPRLEDPPLLAGHGCFVDDLSFPGQVHMRVVRSGLAHAQIRSIDTQPAREVPGVVAVWTSEDTAGIPPVPLRATKIEGLEPYRQPILATGRVRYVGEPVAAVFATDAYAAEDAAARVMLDAEALPALLAADQPPGTFDPDRTTEPTVIRKGYGEVDEAFRSAHTIVELDLSIGRHAGIALETRGALARYDRARRMLELHGAAKRPHWARDEIAKMLGLNPSSFHCFEYHVGGGFGIRGEVYPEDVLVCLAALRLGRPVKWIEDRREHLMAANQSREQLHRIRAAVDAEGRILAIEDTFFHDQGAYVRTHGARVPDMTAGLLLGPYRVPAYRVAGHVRLTNKTPAATYRAPGRFEGTFVRERLMDAIAARLAIDRVDIRRRNLIARSEMPYERPLDAIEDQVILDSGDYDGLLRKALDRFGWDDLQAEMRRRRAAGELAGAGLGFMVEKSGLGPVDGVRVSVDTAGAVEVVTGSASVGQGMETVIAQICADALGVDYRRVRVVHGRTDRIEYGGGAHASRVTVMTGSAARIAAEAVRAKALDVAAELLQAPAAKLEVRDGEVRREGGLGPSVPLAEIARNLAPASAVRGERTPGLTAEGWFRSDHMNYPYGVHLAAVRVDPETGLVSVERYLIAYDVGRAVNPMLIEGQLAGGFTQGLGGALMEEFLYGPDGEPLSVTLADYVMPTATETPRIEALICEDAPSPLNPLGLKGAGEGGITAVGAAIASAIDDAIGMPGAVTRLPVTPARMMELLKRRSRGEATASGVGAGLNPPLQAPRWNP